MSIKVFTDKPYWAKFYELQEERNNAESDAQDAGNLYDAILCGFNMTYLDGEMVGYLDEDGKFQLYDKYVDYTEEQLQAIKVEWCGFDYDGDGYPIVYYVSVKE